MTDVPKAQEKERIPEGAESGMAEGEASDGPKSQVTEGTRGDGPVDAADMKDLHCLQKRPGPKFTYDAVEDPADVAKTFSFPRFMSKVALDGTTKSMCSGLIVDFAKYGELDTPAKHKALHRAAEELGVDKKPMMILDLAPKRDLGLVVDGEEWHESKEEAERRHPPCARILLPVSQIVDVSKLRPRYGKSILRCNASVPTYRWFQAANLLLHTKGTTGRIIPFPLEQEDGNTTYQALRVNMREFKEYQTLLDFAVQQDGIRQGFFIAAKFSYEVLNRRGYSKLHFKDVGQFITDIFIMGDSTMRGVLIENAEPEEDFDELENKQIFY